MLPFPLFFEGERNGSGFCNVIGKHRRRYIADL